MSEIVVNSILEWRNHELNIVSLERVLWISPDGVDIFVINIWDKNNLKFPYYRNAKEIREGLSISVIRKLDYDPDAHILSLKQEYMDKHKTHRDNAWSIIKDLVEKEPEIYIPSKRNKLIQEVMASTGKKPKVIYSYLKKYWAFGKTINALLPNYRSCGAPGKERVITKKTGVKPRRTIIDSDAVGIIVDQQVKNKFHMAIKKLYRKPRKEMSFSEVYRRMLEEFFHEGYYRDENGHLVPILPSVEKLPSERQFRYWYHNEYSKREDMLNKKGETKFALEKRTLLKNSTRRAKGPGYIFEIDATVADVYLVHSVDRGKIIGKPVVYIVKDVYSRVVVGLHIGLQGPSWLGAMMALENTTTDKVNYCKKYGIEIEKHEWPCHHLPQKVTADRGEMEGYDAENLLALGVRIDNTPPYRGDLKGIVEQHFCLINTKIKQWLPGAILKEYRERGERDYRLDAKLTLEAFTQFIILSIIEHNHGILSDDYPMELRMYEEGILPIPLEIWNWGIKNRSGLLQEKPKELIRQHLLPNGKARIDRYGINFKGMCYSCELGVVEGWFEGNGLNGEMNVKIKYDPRCCDLIYIQLKNGTFIKCNLTGYSIEFSGLRFEEVEALMEYRKIEKELNKSNQNKIRAKINAYRKSLIDSEVSKTNESKKANQSNASQIKEIRMNRKNANEQLGNKEAWTTNNKLGASKDEQNVDESKRIEYSECSFKNDSMLGMLLNHTAKRKEQSNEK